MTTKHTPGPLHVQQDSQWPYDIRICDQTGATIHSEPLICSSSNWRGLEDARNLVGIHGDERVEWRRLMTRQMADMRLRAAAPDLLAAGEALANVADDKLATVRETVEAIRVMRAAIARATGEA